MTAPLRFLAGILAFWTCLRAAAFVPWSDWYAAEATPPPMQLAQRPPERRSPDVRAASAAALPAGIRPVQASASTAWVSSEPPAVRPSSPPVGPGAFSPAAALPRTTLLLAPSEDPPHTGEALPALAQRQAAASSRWSLSGWGHLRSGGGASLADRGSLGGSQAGLRIGYRISRSAAAPVTALARLYTPASRPAAAEAALGVEWKPLARIPLRIAAERRQALGREGRSAFSLLAHGGVSELPLGAGFRLDAYGQAGIVGTGSRDLFADASARVVRRAGSDRLSVGAGAWAAAQPGASRLDLGPTIIFAIPGGRATAAFDWRLPVAGAAKPRSGPAVTLSTGF